MNFSYPTGILIYVLWIASLSSYLLVLSAVDSSSSSRYSIVSPRTEGSSPPQVIITFQGYFSVQIYVFSAVKYNLSESDEVHELVVFLGVEFHRSTRGAVILPLND
ncbi:hypothetical protein LX36DRAFT_301203 [Colletotrichum falcatum]|nr:hypothetical protein LX36DRAFT_301203 [Colletotrichum falcatum]